MKTNITYKIYNILPVFLQNVVMTGYGALLTCERYTGEYNKFTQIVDGNLQLTSSQITQLMESNLRRVIQESGKNVPYYRELFKRIGIDFYSDIKTVGDLLKLPLLDKETLRSGQQSFINEKYSRKKLLCIHTTGTTGTPLSIYCNKRSRRYNYAFYDRFLRMNNIKNTSLRATFGGRIIVPQAQTKGPYWRYSSIQRNVLFSAYHLSDSTMDFFIEKLMKIKPAFIDSYPSSVYAIAEYALKKNIDLSGITESITTSAETLYEWQREVIEKAFQVRVVDQYGSAEMCNFVGQCVRGRYHIHSDYSYIEFLRDDGTPAEPGEEAELVCTGFINPVMPLIRYRIGDRGILSRECCECGSPFPVMERLLGRMDDVVLTPDGRKIGRLSPVLKGFPVKEAQYVQNNIHVLEIHIVRGEGYNFDTEIQLSDEIRKRVGDQIALKYKYVDFIDRGKGGKIRSVVSNIVQ